MIKAIAGKSDGRKLVILGLSFENLNRLRKGRLLTSKGEPLGLPMDICIFAGETERSMARQMEPLLGPETNINIDPRVADA